MANKINYLIMYESTKKRKLLSKIVASSLAMIAGALFLPKISANHQPPIVRKRQRSSRRPVLTHFMIMSLGYLGGLLIAKLFPTNRRLSEIELFEICVKINYKASPNGIIPYFRFMYLILNSTIYRAIFRGTSPYHDDDELITNANINLMNQSQDQEVLRMLVNSARMAKMPTNYMQKDFRYLTLVELIYCAENKMAINPADKDVKGLKKTMEDFLDYEENEYAATDDDNRIFLRKLSTVASELINLCRRRKISREFLTKEAK
jgi:hypothetical protein